MVTYRPGKGPGISRNLRHLRAGIPAL